LRYQITASCVLPSLFVASSWVGDSAFAVAVAWAIGYPIAFCVLWWMVLGVLEVRLLAFLRRVGGVIVWVAIATGCGYAAHRLAADLAPTPRLTIVIVVVVGVASVLLARFEQLSIRRAVRSVR
jgi:hypothetical protein